MWLKGKVSLAVFLVMVLPILLARGEETTRLRVLVLSGKNNHEWKETTPLLRKIYDESGRFTADVIVDPSSCTSETLAQYDVVVSNWTNWPSEEREWGAEMEGALIDFVRKGRGFALFHAGGSMFFDWPEFHELIGGTWDKKTTGHGKIHAFEVKISDVEHPITRGMENFSTTDELWHRMKTQSGIRVYIVLREAVKRHQRVFQYGTQQRSGEDFHKACELVRNGRIGKVHTIHAWCDRGEAGGSIEPIPVPKGFDYDMWLGPAPEAPYTKDRCNTGPTVRKGAYHIYDYALGFIAGWGAHPLDIAQWGLDADSTSPIEYDGIGTFPTEGLFDTALQWDVSCTYAGGVKLRFMSAEVAAPVVKRYHPKFIDHGTTFLGNEGWVSVDRQGIYSNPPALLESVIGADEIHLHKGGNHAQDFLNAVMTRQATVSPIEAAVRSDTISHLSDIAVRTRRTIKWDPGTEKLVDDDEASRMLTRAMRSPWRL